MKKPPSKPKDVDVNKLQKKSGLKRTKEELAALHRQLLSLSTYMVKEIHKEIRDPKFWKPFDFGWKRQVTQRNQSNAKDIYYITPNGEKFRSRREISAYCKIICFFVKYFSLLLLCTLLLVEKTYEDHDLTLENFTFSPQPLGVDDPNKEIIRNACFRNTDSHIKVVRNIKKIYILKNLSHLYSLLNMVGKEY